MALFTTLLAYLTTCNIFAVTFVNGDDQLHCQPAKEVCDFQAKSRGLSSRDSELLSDSVGKGAVSCHVQGRCLNETLSELPESTTSLSVTVDKFPDTGVTFSKFIALRNLAILWKYDTDTFMRDDQNELTDSGLFADLTKLESLRISIPIITMNDSLLFDLDNLKYLDLSNIKYFSTNKFASLFNGSQLGNKPLDTLILKRMSGVGTARDRLFLLEELLPLFQGNRLEVLDISNNKVLYLYPGLSQYLPHLKTLSAHDNEIRYISDPNEAICLIIEGILHQNLTHLDITNMGEIGKEIDFYGLNFMNSTEKCISKSWKKNNCVCENFKQTCGRFFTKVNCEPLPEFTLADITNFNPVGHNPDRYCDMYALLPFPKKLEVFRFRKSEVMYKQPQWRNRTLCFQPNSLTLFDASYITFNLAVSSNMLVGWDKVNELDLAYSSWGFYFHGPKFLHTIPQVTILNLTGTNVGIYIRNDTKNQIFEKSVQLRELYLRSAQISFIPYNEFVTLVKLQVLDLSSNHLKDIEFLISPMHSLSLLNISHNSLPRLSSNITSQLEKLPGPVELDMQDNAFMCDCHSMSFVKWVTRTKVKLTLKNSYLCTYQSRGEMSLVTVDTDELTTECYLIYIVTFTVTGFALITIAVIFIVYKYRWNIRTWLLKVTHSKSKVDLREYKYDGFVAYSEKDEQWVTNILMHELENVRNLKLCAHHREFELGEYITENISNAIHNSRKTLLILTKNFLASRSCMYEMRVARNKLLAEGIDVIVPILLAELPDENMDIGVKNLLQEKTYIQWETSMGGQNYFWEKLETTLLDPNKKRNSKIRKRIQLEEDDRLHNGDNVDGVDNADNEALLMPVANH